jgi:hypothetical protein
VGLIYALFVVGLVLMPLANGRRRASLEVGWKGKVFAAVASPAPQVNNFYFGTAKIPFKVVYLPGQIRLPHHRLSDDDEVFPAKRQG